MFSLNSIKRICMTGMASSLVLVALAVPSAKAVVSGSNEYKQCSAEWFNLLTKESGLQKDYDTLQNQIDLLNRQNTDRSLTPQIDDLTRSLDETYYNLRKVRQAIKSLAPVMLAN